MQPLCRQHHRLKGTGMVTVEPVLDADEPPGTVRWSTWTGGQYLHRPAEAAVAPLRPAEWIARVPDADIGADVHANTHPGASVTDAWNRSLAQVRQQEARRREAHPQDKADRLYAGRDDPPPF
jgi:hypothetical protein